MLLISRFFENLCTANQSPESSETGDIKLSTEYLKSGAKDLLRNSFLLLLHTAYSLSGGLCSSRGKHFLDRSRAVLSGCLYGLNCSIALACQLFVSVAGIRKNRKVTDKSGLYVACSACQFDC